MHNLKEANEDTHDDRMANDKLRLVSLFREAFQMQVKITKSFRAGKFNPAKPRLLIATLDSEATKWELIKLAPQLKKHPGFSAIYINPDRTKEEREQGRQLQDELATRRAKGEQNLVIRKGKIITQVGRSQHAASMGPRGPHQVDDREPASVGGQLSGSQVAQTEGPVQLSVTGASQQAVTGGARPPTTAVDGRLAAADSGQHVEGATLSTTVTAERLVVAEGTRLPVAAAAAAAATTSAAATAADAASADATAGDAAAGAGDAAAVAAAAAASAAAAGGPGRLTAADGDLPAQQI